MSSIKLTQKYFEILRLKNSKELFQECSILGLSSKDRTKEKLMGQIIKYAESNEEIIKLRISNSEQEHQFHISEENNNLWVLQHEKDILKNYVKSQVLPSNSVKKQKMKKNLLINDISEEKQQHHIEKAHALKSQLIILGNEFDYDLSMQEMQKILSGRDLRLVNGTIGKKLPKKMRIWLKADYSPTNTLSETLLLYNCIKWLQYDCSITSTLEKYLLSSPYSQKPPAPSPFHYPYFLQHLPKYSLTNLIYLLEHYKLSSKATLQEVEQILLLVKLCLEKWPQLHISAHPRILTLVQECKPLLQRRVYGLEELAKLLEVMDVIVDLGEHLEISIRDELEFISQEAAYTIEHVQIDDVDHHQDVLDRILTLWIELSPTISNSSIEQSMKIMNKLGTVSKTLLINMVGVLAKRPQLNIPTQYLKQLLLSFNCFTIHQLIYILEVVTEYSLHGCAVEILANNFDPQDLDSLEPQLRTYLKTSIQEIRRKADHPLIAHILKFF